MRLTKDSTIAELNDAMKHANEVRFVTSHFRAREPLVGLWCNNCTYYSGRMWHDENSLESLCTRCLAVRCLNDINVAEQSD